MTCIDLKFGAIQEKWQNIEYSKEDTASYLCEFVNHCELTKRWKPTKRCLDFPCLVVLKYWASTTLPTQPIKVCPESFLAVICNMSKKSSDKMSDWLKDKAKKWSDLGPMNSKCKLSLTRPLLQISCHFFMGYYKWAWLSKEAVVLKGRLYDVRFYHVHNSA